MELKLGAVIEEHVEVVNSDDRQYVVVYVALAAGMEPMNPELAVSPPERVPKGKSRCSPIIWKCGTITRHGITTCSPKG